MKTVTVADFLTPAEMGEALKLLNAQAIREKIIEPNIDRINKALGQVNDPMYLAYAVEYVVTQVPRGKYVGEAK